MIRERGDRPDVYGIPRDYFALLRRAAEIPGMTLRWMFAIHPQKRFRSKCFVWKAAGQILELYRRSVDRKRTKAAAVLDNMRAAKSSVTRRPRGRT
jgi:hypothetical protein